MRSGVRVACFYMHVWRVGIVNLDAKEHQNRAATLCTRVLLTCVAHLDLVGDRFKIPATRTRPRFITEIRKILYVGYHRIFL